MEINCGVRFIVNFIQLAVTIYWVYEWCEKVPKDGGMPFYKACIKTLELLWYLFLVVIANVGFLSAIKNI
ncbi:MAG: hypothetical protein J6R22_02790 [Alphaproteobacteria bacterium]|nr:hypothetical protein [Alphaproteobacteria bacterium]